MVNSSSTFEIKQARQNDWCDNLFEQIKQLRLSIESGKAKLNKEATGTLCLKIYQGFKKAKFDFENNLLNQPTYFALLHVLKILLDNLNDKDGEALHQWEVLSECYRYGLI